MRSSSIVRGWATIVFLCVAGVLLWMRAFLSLDIRKDSHAFPNSTSSHPLPALSSNLSDILFPVPLTPGHSPLIRENHMMLHSLFRCIERRDCHENQTKVVIVAAQYFRDYLGGSRGGESIWAGSTMRALANMGYTYLYTPFPSNLHTIQLYNMLQDLVKVIFVDSDESHRCFHDTNDCALSEENPTGIPPWKMFSFHFWTGAQNPLGERWTVSPEDYVAMGLANNTYLGYSIEESCRQQPFIPHSERENQAYILAKYLFFFEPEHDPAWTPANFDAVADATGITFTLASLNITLEGQSSPPQLPSNYVNLGQIGQPKFLEVLSTSRILIGMGNPALSPSPYDALCLGVPFINPIMNWDRENPSDKSHWQTQHYALQALGPPYVYNVFKGDTEGLVQAVKDALLHPIDSYVLERMTISSVERRLAAILETDWHSEAQLLETDW